MKGLRSAFGFLTSVPMGSAPPDGATYGWFPAAGAAIGLVIGAVWWGAGEAWPAGVAAAIAVTADLALTGAIHFDGLADSADGLLPPMRDDARMEVMARPDVGAFGIAAAAVALLLRTSSMASLAPDVLLIAALWCEARTIMVLAARTQPYVGGGLAAAFAGEHHAAAVAPGIAGFGLAAGLAAVAHGWGGVAAVAAGAVAALGVIALARRRLGGVSGDVLGAAGIVAETIGLVVAAARW